MLDDLYQFIFLTLIIPVIPLSPRPLQSTNTCTSSVVVYIRIGYCRIADFERYMVRLFICNSNFGRRMWETD